MTATPGLSAFRRAYGAHRAAEGRTYDARQLRALPYLRTGPLAAQWAIRARTFDAFVGHVLNPMLQARRAERPLGRPAAAPRLLDLGAGNCWLARRAALAGCEALAVDIRDDAADGLGAADALLDATVRFERVVASFEELPFNAAVGKFDLVVFNASLHYAVDLSRTLAEAHRLLRPGDAARLVVLDSPFYAREEDGLAMVAEKRRNAFATFGANAQALMALPCVEFLTPERLHAASTACGVVWQRIRVRYPLQYELRPLASWWRGRRHPSRFDLWVGTPA